MQIYSKKKKILIFSDVHQDIFRLEKIVNAEKADINLCLGDWFDSPYYDTDAYVADAAKYLKYFIQEKNCYSLLGNHDASYLYPSVYTICSRYEKRKFELIMDVMGKDLDIVRQKLLWHVWVDDILCSHAGLHPLHIKTDVIDKDHIEAFLIKEEEAANKNLLNGRSHWIYGAGYARGGWQDLGGLNWLDFRKEFWPIKGIPQIVGHTTSKDGKIVGYKLFGNALENENLCIDCRLNEYLVITNGIKEIKKYADL